MKDYYGLLGVSKSATKKEIKRNYRILATKYHPDKSKDPASASKFIAITEAYDVLSHQKSRDKYDSFVLEKLKRRMDSEDSYNVVVPPSESTRTRRNKAQQKRSIKYHQEKSTTQKKLKLLQEGVHIFVRYITRILGVTLLIVIIKSVMSELAASFEKGLLPGLFICLIMAAILYTIFWILRSAYQEMKMDLEAFSVFFRESKQKVTMITLSVFLFFLAIYASIIFMYF